MDRKQQRQKQAEKQLGRLEVWRVRELVAIAVEKEAMGRLLGSKDNIAKQTKDKMKELLDMDLVGDNSSTETIRG
jgi:hypothetical protein